MVCGAGFKPVGVERRSGSIPPSGRELLQLILVRNKELVRMVEETFTEIMFLALKLTSGYLVETIAG